MSFSLIACIGKNNEIGKDGKLIFHLKDDLKFFRKTTLNHKILMGRKTWDSLPAKLQDRESIVVSRHEVKGADVIINDLPKYIHDYENSDEEIFIIGGGMIYVELLPYTKDIYLTEVDATSENADAFFPSFDKTHFTRKEIEKGTENGLNYVISKYTRKN